MCCIPHFCKLLLIESSICGVIIHDGRDGIDGIFFSSPYLRKSSTMYLSLKIPGGLHKNKNHILLIYLRC